MLIAFGNYCGNHCVINYWFYDQKAYFELTYVGLFHSLIFNFACLMAVLSHIRCSVSDPGHISSDVEFPDYVETS